MTIGTYWVLGTDYESYASVYSCKSLLGFALEYSWILVRDVNPSEEVLEKAQAAFISNGLGIDNFETVDQSNCTYEDPQGEDCSKD